MYLSSQIIIDLETYIAGWTTLEYYDVGKRTFRIPFCIYSEIERDYSGQHIQKSFAKIFQSECFQNI